MTTTIHTPTMPATISKRYFSAVLKVLSLRAEARTHRERVEEIEISVLSRKIYNIAPEWRGRVRSQTDTLPDRITNPRHSYLMEDSDAKEYFLAVRQQLIISGYEIETPDENGSYKCPALVAESALCDAEWALIDIAAVELGIGENFGKELYRPGHREAFLENIIGLAFAAKREGRLER